MKRFVQSGAYARMRLVSAGLFILFGSAILVKTISSVGLTGAALPAYVLGAAMVALGAFRYRDYLAARNRR
jgi:hypothetical protein